MPRKKKDDSRKINPGTMKRLLGYMKPYRATLIVVFICIVASSIAGVSDSMFMQRLIDNYIMPLLGKSNPDFSGLYRILCVMAGIFLAGVMGTLIYNRQTVKIAQKVLKTVRDQMFSHMQRLPIRYFDTHKHGDVMSLYTNDTDTLRQMIAQSLPSLISSTLQMVAVLCCMLYLSVWLTLITMLLLVPVLLIVGRFAKRISKYFVGQQKSLADLNGYVEEMISGQKVVKVFNHEKDSVADMKKLNAKWRENSTMAVGQAGSIMPMMNAMGYMIYVIIAVIGGYMAINHVPNLGILSGSGVLSLGMIASFLTLIRSFVGPIGHISNQMNSVIAAMAGASRIFEFLDEPVEVDDGVVTLVNCTVDSDGVIHESNERTGKWAWKDPRRDEAHRYTLLTGAITMDHVDFGYNPDKTILHDITLYADPGQKIAFVGATGAGKTTIMSLINRFYDVADGKIHYDGININDIKKSDLRRSLGMVQQDVNLFTGTVMDNIRFGNPKATDEECIEAAKLANADDFIRMLPNGYETVLDSGGAELSQGQRQLISIARAAVSNPPVMILDEATSSIDTHTESLVQDGMDKLMQGRTVFVIAHRLSTVQNSDVIMVLDHGHIIERGNHDQLIAERGVYYQLYTGAFELE